MGIDGASIKRQKIREQESKQVDFGKRRRTYLAFLLIFIIYIMGVIASSYTSPTYNSSNSRATANNSTAQEWYEGGTLHKATVAEWQNASYTNKIATAADWIANSPKGKSLFRETGDVNSLKPYVLNLIKFVDEAAAGEGLGNMKISEIAVSGIILLGYGG